MLQELQELNAYALLPVLAGSKRIKKKVPFSLKEKVYLYLTKFACMETDSTDAILVIA